MEDRVTPAAGQLDPTFGDDGRVTTRFPASSGSYCTGVAIDSLGRVVVAGFTNNGSNEDFAITRYTAAGALDALFGGTGIVTIDFNASYDQALAVAVDSLDRVVVAGYTDDGSGFDFAVARLTSSGALDVSFDGDGKQTIAFNAHNMAYGLAIDSLDRVIVAGYTHYGSTDELAVARLTAAGALDASFDGDGKQTIAFSAYDVRYGVVAVDSLDRVVVAGQLDNGPSYDFAVARLTAAGALDASFDGDGKQAFDLGFGDADILRCMAVDSLDRVVVAGNVGFLPSTDFAVARLTAAGALDASFDGDGKKTFDIGFGGADAAIDVTVDSLDRVVVAGATGVLPFSDFAVARLTATGAFDDTFDDDGKQYIGFGAPQNYAHGVAVDSLDRVVVAGYTGVYPVYDVAVARLTAEGALDAGFDGDGKLTTGLLASSIAGGQSVAVDSKGRTVVAGYAFNGSNNDFAITRYTASGALDTTFGNEGIVTIAFGAYDDYAYGVAVDSLDRVVVAGSTNNGSDYDFAVARLTASGALDASFDGDGKQTIDFGGDDEAYGVAVDSLDRLVVAGSTKNGSGHDFTVARLTAAGVLDTSFDGDGKQTIDFGGDDKAYSVAVDSLDRVVIAGYTLVIGSKIELAVARLTGAGALDASFDGDGKQIIAVGTSMEDVARAVAVDSLDRVVVAGYTFNGSTYDVAVVRLTAVGALDSTFDGDGKQTVAFGAFDGQANGVAVDSLDRVVVAGSTFDGSNYDIAVARLTAAGALDGSFDGDGKQTIVFGANDEYANGVAVDSQGRVVVVGQTNLNGQVCAVARLTGDTTHLGSIQISDGSAQRSRVTSLKLAFDQAVTLPANPADAFQLKRQSDGAQVVLNASMSGNIVTLTFTGGPVEFGSLADGRYTLTALASQINGGNFDGNGDGMPGDDYVVIGSPANGLFRLFGDADGNGVVDAIDFGAFRQAFGTNGAIFDFDGGGSVDALDFGEFRRRFGAGV